MPDIHGICEHCNKPVIWETGKGYVHESNGYFKCVPGRPEDAMTAKYREYLESGVCLNA
jgi:hypothetical protein